MMQASPISQAKREDLSITVVAAGAAGGLVAGILAAAAGGLATGTCAPLAHNFAIISQVRDARLKYIARPKRPNNMLTCVRVLATCIFHARSSPSEYFDLGTVYIKTR